MVSLKNKSKRTKIVNLSHAIVCGAECVCESSDHRSLQLNGKTGETAVRLIERKICPSVHLLPGAWSPELPDDVLQLPEVKAGIGKLFEVRKS